MSCLLYLCLLAHSGAQHILCCVLVLVLSVLIFPMTTFTTDNKLTISNRDLVWVHYTCIITYIMIFTVKDVNIKIHQYVGGLMSCLLYLCLLAHSGAQHILCCVLVLVLSVLCIRYAAASFSGLSIFKLVFVASPLSMQH
jgi:hypothetical protein